MIVLSRIVVLLSPTLKLLKLQQAVREKTCRSLPPSTLKDWNNLSYLAMMTSYIGNSSIRDDSFTSLADFWPRCLDIYIEVCEWMGYEGEATWIQEKKKIMLMTFGEHICDEVLRFDSYFLK